MKFKLLFACLAAVCTQGIVAAQQSSVSKPSTWQPYYKDAKVEIEYKYGDCNISEENINQQEVYLRFVNVLNTDIIVKYEQEIQFGDDCLNCNGGQAEHTKTIYLKPFQSIEGSCDVKVGSELKLFSKFYSMPNKAVLEAFKIKNVSVKILDK